jgi:uncharacterized protein YcaQ
MALTLKQIRRLALAGQGLSKSDPFGRGINAVERTIKQLHYIQIDTISVVQRAHLHVLNTRVSNFTEHMLHRLLAQRRTIFEYWSHAAAYLPMEDYRFYLPVMHAYAASRETDSKLGRHILDRINTEGPLQSRDFADPRSGKGNGWWDWKPSKRVLEHLFLSGELMVSERQGFQKVYDLRERVLPAATDTSTPSEQERGEFYVRRMLSALGIATAREIGYSRTAVAGFSQVNIQPMIAAALASLLERGEISAIPFSGETCFVLTTALEQLPAKIARPRLRVLSPFDNLVINRRRLATLFNFDYQLECYVPQAKRRYGYFVLPLLLGDRFVGRMDCKIHRGNGTLAINNIWLESLTLLDDVLVHDLAQGLRQYANGVGCATINLMKTADPQLKPLLSRAWNQD